MFASYNNRYRHGYDMQPCSSSKKKILKKRKEEEEVTVLLKLASLKTKNIVFVD